MLPQNNPTFDPFFGSTARHNVSGLEQHDSRADVDREGVVGNDREPNDTYEPHRVIRPLHGVKPPPIEYQKENFRHRQIAYMAAAGMSQRAVADAMGMSPMNVSFVYRQEWFRDLVNSLIDENQGTALDLLQAAVKDSVWKLIDLRDDPTAPKAVQMNCAVNIVDRVLGKPTQFVETKQSLTVNDAKEADDLIARLQKELEGLAKAN